jgi:hypothetical protein
MRNTSLERYLDQGPFQQCDGEYVTLDSFVGTFHEWLGKTGRDTAEAWPRERIKRELGIHFPVGYGAQNKVVIGNISDKFTRPRRFVRLDDGRVRLEQPA